MTEEELGSESFSNMSKITQWRVMEKIEYHAQWMQTLFGPTLHQTFHMGMGGAASGLPAWCWAEGTASDPLAHCWVGGAVSGPLARRQGRRRSLKSLSPALGWGGHGLKSLFKLSWSGDIPWGPLSSPQGEGYGRRNTLKALQGRGAWPEVPFPSQVLCSLRSLVFGHDVTTSQLICLFLYYIDRFPKDFSNLIK